MCCGCVLPDVAQFLRARMVREEDLVEDEADMPPEGSGGRRVFPIKRMRDVVCEGTRCATRAAQNGGSDD